MDPLPTQRAGASAKDRGSPSARKHLLEVLPAPQSRQNRPRTALQETRTFQLPPFPSPQSQVTCLQLPYVTSYHKPGVLKQPKFVLSLLEGRSPKSVSRGLKSRGGAGLCPLQGLREESTPHLSQLLVTACNLQDLLRSPCFLFCVWQSSLGFSYKDTCHCF